MSGSRIRLLRAGMGIILLAFVATASHAQKPKEPWDYLNEPALRSAYTKALGPKSELPWLAKRDGPAPLPSFIEVGGDRANSASCGRRNGAAAELHAEVSG